MYTTSELATFPITQGSGPQTTTQTVHLPGPVSQAVAILTGFDVEYSHGDVQGAPGSKPITLPPEYVRDHVELGYATTVHRAQGQTVDTAHAIVTGPSMTREALYVAATRAREANQLYVAVDDARDVEASQGAGEYPTARDVLKAVLNNLGTDLSAHETWAVGQHRATRVVAATPAAEVRDPRCPVPMRTRRLDTSIATDAVGTPVALGR